MGSADYRPKDVWVPSPEPGNMACWTAEGLHRQGPGRLSWVPWVGPIPLHVLREKLRRQGDLRQEGCSPERPHGLPSGLGREGGGPADTPDPQGIRVCCFSY